MHIVHEDMVTLWVAPTSLLLNTADVFLYAEWCGVSSAECHVSVVKDEVCVRLIGFVVCVVGQMAQDVGIV